MGNSASIELKLVTSAAFPNPAVSTIEPYPSGYKSYSDALFQTTFQKDGENAIGVIRNLQSVFNGGMPNPEVEVLTYDVHWPNHAEVVPHEYIKNLSPFTALAANGFFPRNGGTGDLSLFDTEGVKTVLTAEKPGWFYHKVEFQDMNGNGLKDIITARTSVPMTPIFPGASQLRPDVDNASTELLWLEQPEDGVASGQPWEEHIIQEGGAGVNFEVVDMDKNGQFQILSPEFFVGKQLALLECDAPFWSTCTGDKATQAVSVVVIDQEEPVEEKPVNLELAGLPPCFATRGQPPCNPDAALPACFLLPPQAPPGTPCDDTIPQPLRFFSARFADLNNDGVDDILASMSPHVQQGKGQVLAYECPATGNWRVDAWTKRVISEGPRYALSGNSNGSPGEAQTFEPFKRFDGRSSQPPSILLSGDDASFAAVLTPKVPFNWEYEFDSFTASSKIMGSPAISYSFGSWGFAQFAVPRYSDNTIEFWKYSPTSWSLW